MDQNQTKIDQISPKEEEKEVIKLLENLVTKRDPDPLLPKVKKHKLTPAMEANKWKPGQVANPLGRSKNKPYISDSLYRLLKKKQKSKLVENASDPNITYAEAIARILLAGARQRSGDFIKIILERMEGSIAQKREITGADGGPIQLSFSDFVRKLSIDDAIDADAEEIK